MAGFEREKRFDCRQLAEERLKAVAPRQTVERAEVILKAFVIYAVSHGDGEALTLCGEKCGLGSHIVGAVEAEELARHSAELFGVVEVEGFRVRAALSGTLAGGRIREVRKVS